MSELDAGQEEHPAPAEPSLTHQNRIRVIAQQIAALEDELLTLAGGSLDSLYAQAYAGALALPPTWQALQQVTEHCNLVFDGVLDCLFLCDNQRRYVDLNEAACRLLDLPKEEVIGRQIGEFFEFVGVADLDAEWQTLLEGEQTRDIYTCRRPDGALLLIEYSLVRDIEPGLHMLVVRDITEQMRTIEVRDELNIQLERRNHGLVALHGIGVKLGESLKLHEVYETIFRQFTFHFLECPHLAVALYDKQNGYFYCDFAVVDGEIYDAEVFPPMPLGEGPTSRAFLEMTPQIVDITELSTKLPKDRIIHIGDEAHPKSGIYVPLVVNNEAIGVLSMQHYEADAFHEIDLTLVSVMANHAAAAISNALLYQQTQQEIADRMRRERELAAIAALSRSLRTVQGQAAVLATLSAQIHELFNAAGIAIVLDINGEQEIVESRGDFEKLTGTRLGSRRAAEQPSLLNGRAQIERTLWGKQSGIINGVGFVPLSVQNISLGTVVLGLVRSVGSEDVALLASLADIAASTLQRARLYEQVQLQAQRLTRVMETVAFGLLLLDKECRILIANQPALEEMARLRAERPGEQLRSLGGVALEKILTTPHGDVFGQEILVEGEPDVIYDILANPVEMDGEIDGWVLVIRDITRDREIQTQLQRQDRLAAVGQLAAGIAHDFNNVLAVIILYVQMMERSSTLGEDDQKRLKVVLEQAQHAGELVRQVLDFSRMSVIERREIDLVGLIHSTLGLWERILPETIRYSLDVQLDTVPDVYFVDAPSEGFGSGAGPHRGRTDLADDVSRSESRHDQADARPGLPSAFTVFGDSARLQQVLMNLALNASDAMPNGGELKIHLGRRWFRLDERLPAKELSPGHWLYLVVEDTGEGIAPEFLPHIFDPFFTTKGVGKGTGLGLAQVYGIVRQHGGHVFAESRPGQGTQFHIYLPAVLHPALAIEDEEEPLDESRGAGRILLVEDNPAAREATLAILELNGYDVIQAENGVAAWRIFETRSGSIDLILSDLVMPEMGGLALYRVVARLKPEQRMLFMTGYPLDDEARRMIEYGTVDWLQKPFTIQQLTQKIERLLSEET